MGFFDFIATYFGDTLGDFTIHLLTATLAFELTFVIFYLALWIITALTTVLYVLSLGSLLINVTAILDSNSGLYHGSDKYQLLPTGSSLNNLADWHLNAFDSIFGWGIFGLGGLFFVLFIVFVLGKGLLSTMRTYVWTKSADSGGKSGGFSQWFKKYADGETFWKNLLKGALILIFTLAALGFLYAAYTVIVLGLCVLISFLLETVVGTLSSDGMSAIQSSVKNFSLTQTSNGTKYNFVPSVFGPYNWFGFAQPSYGTATPVMLPTYIFYALLKTMMYQPTISMGGGTQVLNPIGGTLITQYVTLDAFFGIGFILLPWWGLTLGLLIYMGFGFVKIFIQALYRIFVLVALFFVLIAAAYYALADGGKFWWQMMASVTRWFFYNAIYIVILNLMCLTVFFVFFVGQVIVNGIETWYNPNWSEITKINSSGIGKVFTNSSSNVSIGGEGGAGAIGSLGLGEMSGFTQVLLNIILGVFSYVLGAWTSGSVILGQLVLTAIVVAAFATAKVVDKKINAAYFKDDKVHAYGQEIKGEFTKAGIFAGVSTFGLYGVKQFSTGLFNKVPAFNRWRTNLNAKGQQKRNAFKAKKSLKNGGNKNGKGGFGNLKGKNLANGEATGLYDNDGKLVGTLSKDKDLGWQISGSSNANFKKLKDAQDKGTLGQFKAFDAKGTSSNLSEILDGQKVNFANSRSNNRQWFANQSQASVAGFAQNTFANLQVNDIGALRSFLGKSLEKYDPNLDKNLSSILSKNNVSENDFFKKVNESANPDWDFNRRKAFLSKDIGLDLSKASDSTLGNNFVKSKLNIWGKMTDSTDVFGGQRNGNADLVNNVFATAGVKRGEEVMSRERQQKLYADRANLAHEQMTAGMKDALIGLGGAVWYGLASGATGKEKRGAASGQQNFFNTGNIFKWIGAEKLANWSRSNENEITNIKSRIEQLEAEQRFADSEAKK